MDGRVAAFTGRGNVLMHYIYPDRQKGCPTVFLEPFCGAGPPWSVDGSGGLAGRGGFPFGGRGPLEPRELRFNPAISGVWRGALAGRERGPRGCWLCGRAIPVSCRPARSRGIP